MSVNVGQAPRRSSAKANQGPLAFERNFETFGDLQAMDVESGSFSELSKLSTT